MFASKLQLATSFICNLQVFFFLNWKYDKICSYYFLLVSKASAPGPCLYSQKVEADSKAFTLFTGGVAKAFILFTGSSLFLSCAEVSCWHLFCLLSLVPFGVPQGLHRLRKTYDNPSPRGTKESKENRCQKNTSKTSSLQFPLQNRGGWHPQFCRVSLRPCFATKSKTIGWQMPKNP